MKAQLAALAAVILIPLAARADIPPPETEPCKSASAGQACTYQGAKGTCQQSTCTGLDYSVDASVPGSRTYECLKCLDTKVPTDGGGSGCSLAPSGPRATDLLALALAGTFSGLFLLARRRRK